MKKLKYLLIVTLLFPITVFATNQNTEVGTNMSWDQCIANTDTAFSSNGHGYYSQCKKISCLTGTYTQEYLFSSKLVTCTNGNKDMYTRLIRTGCGGYQGSCSPTVDVKYCSYVMYFDCTLTSNGSTYIGKTTITPTVTTTTTTRRTTTTRKTTTTRRHTTTRRATTTTPRKTTKPAGTTTNPTTSTTIAVKSNNAYLQSLKLTPGEIQFNKETLEYTISVDKDVKDITVEAIPESATATVKIKNNEKISSKKPIYVIVTAEDGITKLEYKINLELTDNGPKLSSNSKLSSLTIKGYNLNFKPEVKEYKIKIDKDVNALDIEATPEDAKAKYEITGNEQLKNKSKITIKVTAEDETTTDYIITIKKGGSNIIVIILIIIVLGIAGVVGFKLIRNLIPAKEDENYDYE